MSLKSWVLDRVNRMNALVGRADLAPRDSGDDAFATTAAPPETLPGDLEHLGVYAALVRAVREELEHFVIGALRLHLAIADRDRFTLTSIGVRCPDDGEARALLSQFMREFKPEQVKRYLAREVIAGLPNASAIDLSQFAGLFDAGGSDDAHDYRELILALRGDAPPSGPAAYQVSIVGRWTEQDAHAGAAPAAVHSAGTPATPLAGLRWEFEVEDSAGRRRVVLQAVVPGRRYLVGKGEGCDIRLDGTYTSRRHAELWLDGGAWWVADAGSTNGLRLELPGGRVLRLAASSQEGPARLEDGAQLVLSGLAVGGAAVLPALLLRPSWAARVTPIAGGMAGGMAGSVAGGVPSSSTPVTPVLPVRGAEGALVLMAELASGERRLELRSGALPITVGRSRHQQLVVDRAHESVSGHHLDIVELDDAGAQVVVHGDNGVTVEGVAYPAGASFRWKVGDTMVLGPAAEGERECTLRLARRT